MTCGAGAPGEQQWPSPYSTRTGPQMFWSAVCSSRPHNLLFRRFCGDARAARPCPILRAAVCRTPVIFGLVMLLSSAERILRLGVATSCHGKGTADGAHCAASDGSYEPRQPSLINGLN